MNNFANLLIQINALVGIKLRNNTIDTDKLEPLLERAVSLATSQKDLISILDLVKMRNDKLSRTFYYKVIKSPLWSYDNEFLLWDTHNDNNFGEHKELALQSGAKVTSSSNLPSVIIWKNFNNLIEGVISNGGELTRQEAKIVLLSLTSDYMVNSQYLEAAWQILQKVENFPFVNDLSSFEEPALSFLAFLHAEKISTNDEEIKNIFYEPLTESVFIIYNNPRNGSKFINSKEVVDELDIKINKKTNDLSVNRKHIWFPRDDFRGNAWSFKKALINKKLIFNDYFIEAVEEKIKANFTPDYLPLKLENTSVPPLARISRVGGSPDFVTKVDKNNQVLWPHYMDEGTYHPLKFLAQLMLAEDKAAYVFYSIENIDDTNAEDYMDTDAANAVLIEGEEPPSWITLQPIDADSIPLWSATAAASTFDINKIYRPRYLQPAKDMVSGRGFKFIYQITSWYADKYELSFGDGGDLYIYWNKKDQARVTLQSL